jgi:hypothetical protein
VLQVSKNVLNDRTLVAFVDERIVHLKLSGASAHITDAGLESITHCCSGLQSLSLYGVSNCSPDALARLFSVFPSLRPLYTRAFVACVLPLA